MDMGWMGMPRRPGGLGPPPPWGGGVWGMGVQLPGRAAWGMGWMGQRPRPRGTPHGEEEGDPPPFSKVKTGSTLRWGGRSPARPPLWVVWWSPRGDPPPPPPLNVDQGGGDHFWVAATMVTVVTEKTQKVIKSTLKML